MDVQHLYDNLREFGRKCHITSVVIGHIVSPYETLSCHLKKNVTTMNSKMNYIHSIK